MMPLSLAEIGEENIIKRIGGKPEVKKHLENLFISWTVMTFWKKMHWKYVIRNVLPKN